MKRTIIEVIIIVTVIFAACERVQATPEECVDNITLAQAVVDRGLSWNQYLACGEEN